MSKDNTGLQPDSREAAGRSLDRTLIRGIAWTGGARLLTQVLSWAATIVVARLLTPRDYGLMGMATVYMGVVQLANEFGLGAAIVQMRDLDEQKRASIGGLAVALGFVFFIVSAVLATPIAGFFGEPAVRDIILVLGATFIVAGIRVLPYAQLSRDLEFARLARIEAFSTILQTVATLAMASLGFRYWSLVLGTILGLVTSTVLSLVAHPHRLAWPRSVKPILEPLTLGWQLTVARLGWYTYSNADFVVVGRVLSTTALGAYTFGWQLASIPVDKVSAVLGQVLSPIFSSVKHDMPALARYVRVLTEGLAIVTFPLAFGLALVADDLVLFALGAEWEAAIVPLRLLALYTGFRSLVTMFPQVLVSIGRARVAMWVNIVLVLVMPASFYLGAQWGVAGVALAWIIAYPLVVVPTLVLPTIGVIGLPLRDYMRALQPAVSGTLIMSATVLLLRSAIPARWPGVASLAAQVGAGGVAYAATLWLLHADRIRALAAYLKSSRRSAPPVPEPSLPATV